MQRVIRWKGQSIRIAKVRHGFLADNITRQAQGMEPRGRIAIHSRLKAAVTMAAQAEKPVA